jgi:hypothetical protein
MPQAGLHPRSRKTTAKVTEVLTGQQETISTAREIQFFSRSLFASWQFVLNLVLACAVVAACAIMVFKFWSRFREQSPLLLMLGMVILYLINAFIGLFGVHGRVQELDLKGITSNTVPVRTLLTALIATQYVMLRSFFYHLLTMLFLLVLMYLFASHC